MYTWHLSVVDAGQPRGSQAAQIRSVHVDGDAPGDESLWDDDDLDEGEWILVDWLAEPAAGWTRELRFGLRGAFPIAATSTATASSKSASSRTASWFIDLNDNGIWDEGDLWAKLGHQRRSPGHRRLGRRRQDRHRHLRSGLVRAIRGPWRTSRACPIRTTKHGAFTRTFPRPPQHTAVGRADDASSPSTGKPRADLIDHVFLYGTPGDHPIVGDWNGDGTHRSPCSATACGAATSTATASGARPI